MKHMKRSLIVLAVLFLLLYVLVYVLTFHPPLEKEEIVTCTGDLPELQVGQNVKVLSWNIQYLVGEGYVFWYDTPDGSGKDDMVKKEDIWRTLDQVVNVIKEENPDVILFQELHKGSKRSQYTDQVKMLVEKLKKTYGCYSSSYYFKNIFLPHPRIMGSENMKFMTFSKYKITKAIRYQLPLIQEPWPVSTFNFRRALFEVRVPVKDANDFSFVNTHLDAFAQGSNTMQKQVERTDKLLSRLTQEKLFWVIGGDFNLLAADGLRDTLSERHKKGYNHKTELSLLTKKYNMFPTIEDIMGDQKEKWYTHAPNDYVAGAKPVGVPDRTIDYMFYSNNLKLLKKEVKHQGTRGISDHMPLIAEFQIGK